MAACLSAARAALAITVIADRQRGEGLRVVAKAEHVPKRPMARLYAFASQDNPVSTVLIEAAQQAGQSRFTRRGRSN